MLAVVGSRRFMDYKVVESALLEWQEKNVKIEKIISGGAEGIDALAEEFSKKHGLGDPITFKPDYAKYHWKIAPKMRNSQIVDAADYMIAFPDQKSTGTWDSVQKAYKKGIPVTIHKL